MNIAASIARLRRERGMTQEALAEVIGVSPQTISKWENNTTYPDIALLPVLADDRGVIAVYGLGCDTARKALPGELAWIIQFHQEERETDAGKDDEENEHAQ